MVRARTGLGRGCRSASRLRLGVYIRRCLQKDPKQRIHVWPTCAWRSRARSSPTALADAGLGDAGTRPTTGRGRPRSRLPLSRPPRSPFPRCGIYARRPPPAPAETRTEIVTPTTDDPASFALSPDGRQIVFVASGDGAPRLWLRSLATTKSAVASRVDGATAPFWAPDSRSLGFFAAGWLKRLDLWAAARRRPWHTAGRSWRNVER